MDIRTDLALELHERRPKGHIDGVKVRKRNGDNFILTDIEITNERGSNVLSKPIGRYITLETDGFNDTESFTDGRLDALTDTLSSLLPDSGDILVAGLGNTAITPDALGPLCAQRILATRHIPEETSRALHLPKLRRISVITPGVAGKTGMESSEIIAGVVEKIKPSAVLAVDALAAGSVKRLGTTVQISTSGIEPGSGVGNKRTALNVQTLGVPVIAVGVPTVVDALTLAKEISGENDLSDEAQKEFFEFTVTPRDTDSVTLSAARFTALAINLALHKNLSKEDILSLTRE